MLQNVKLPDSAMAGFLIYPTKLLLNFGNVEDSDFLWHASNPNANPDSTKTTWSERHRGFFYMATNEDINRYIKLTILPKMGTRNGLPHEIVCKNPVAAG